MKSLFIRIKGKLKAIFFNYIYNDFKPCSIVSAKETLNELLLRLSQKKDTTYLRFGDGDIFLLNNKSGRKQVSSKELQNEYKDCFSMSGENIVKSIPIHSKKYGYEYGMKKGTHLQTDKNADILLSLCAEYFLGSAVYSPVALHHCLIHEIELSKAFFKELKIQCNIFIGNNKNDISIINELLSPNLFIETPQRDAYSHIQVIFNELCDYIENVNTDKFITLVFSCGTTAKILMKRIRGKYPNKTFYLFDLGSVIDVFHGRDDWTWVREHKIKLQNSICEIRGCL